MITRRLSRIAKSSRCRTEWPRNCRRHLSSWSKYLEFDHGVEEAIKNGEPVVALESTIVAHGMPFPQNLETAQSVESIVRSKVRFGSSPNIMVH
jgi:pseudouridine-5'-phosphate glycosidase